MITDFGISARVRSTFRKNQAEEQSGGTLAYMGPERFSANPKPIMASDVWSLGAMMFELMSEDYMPPFGNHGGVLQKNGADIPELGGEYSKELKDIVYRCLAKETWDRPTSRMVAEAAYNKLHGIPINNIIGKEEPVSGPTSTEKELEKEQKKETKKQGEGLKGTVFNVGGEKKTKDANNKGGQQSKEPKKKDDATSLFKKYRFVIAGVAGVVLVALIVVFLRGGDSDNTPEVEMVVVERVNYDSIYQITIQDALKYIQEGDSIVNRDDALDEKYLLEEKYIAAFNKYDEIIKGEYRDSIPADLMTEAKAQQEAVRNSLNNIYKEINDKIDGLKKFNLDTSAFQARADKIKKYITNLSGEENEEAN